MHKRGIRGSFGMGGTTEHMVKLLEEGILDKILTIQAFDQYAIESLMKDYNHIEISAGFYANPHNRGTAVNLLNVVVLGATEIEYIQQLEAGMRIDTLKQLFADQPRLIIFACNTRPCDDFLAQAKNHQVALISSPLTANRIIEVIGFYLRSILSDKETRHGVFMEVMGLGVLLSGSSGIGKSELALELLSRGHRLIADDAPEFFQASPDTLHGRCPKLLSNFIEVRGLGILNVSAMFGDNAIVTEKQLSLIVNLEPEDDIKPNDSNVPGRAPIERLGFETRSQTILDVEIPEVTLPLGPGRNMAVIIEAAARNHVLHLRGYNAAEDFIQRQREMINKSQS